MNYFEVNGYGEKLEAAYKLQEETRAASLFMSEMNMELCGEPIHPLSLRHFQLFALGGNGLFDGEYKDSDPLNFIWVLSRNNKPDKPFNEYRRKRTIRRVVKWAKDQTAFEPEAVIVKTVCDYIDGQTLDMPGKYGVGGSGNFHFPACNTYLSLITEVMSSFPSYRFNELWTMPVSMFFQLLKVSHKNKNPEYKGDQLTDAVVRWGLAEYRKLKNGSDTY